MPKILRHLFTGKDGETWDLGRVSWAGCFLAVVGHDAMRPGSLQDLAVALAAVTAAHGFALGFKAKTEPEAAQ